MTCLSLAAYKLKVPALYIVKAGSPLLDLNLIKALKISIMGGKVEYNGEDNAKTPPIITQ